MNADEKEGKLHIVEADLRGRLKWLIILRAALMTLLLGVLLLSQIGRPSPLSSLYIPAVLLGSIYVLTLFYAFLLNKIKNLLMFSIGQLLIDVLIETVLVTVTGSVESPFSFLYIISIISGSLLLNRTGGIFIASAAFIFYGTIVDLEFFQWGWFGYIAPTRISEAEIFYSFFLYLVVFFTVAILSGMLADKLRHTQKALDESDRGLLAFRAFHENVVRSMGSGLLTANLEGEILSFNHAAELITGYEGAETLGKKWWKMFGWESVPVNPIELEEGLISLRFDQEGQKKDGGRLLIGMTLSILKDDEGKKKGFVGTFQDLTKIKDMEETVKIKERLAHLGEMAAGIAHEIRNPLASLSGSMEMLSQELTLKDHQQKLMQIALNEAERLNHLIGDFLNYARPRPLQKKETLLKTFLEEEIFLFKNSAAIPEGINIQLDIDQFQRPVSFDQDLMKQVFWNLSINACEAMPQGGLLKISGKWSSPAKGSSEWRLLFEDSGSGIPPDAIGKIFNPFYSTKEQGTGLGLSIVHRIVEEHGGKIKVHSRPGQGAQFKLTFPADEKEAGALNMTIQRESTVG
jgi:two-component system sensor histidine kinase PilS (NtrC family)